MTDAASQFDDVLGPGRGGRPDSDEPESPLAIARRLVRYLNSDECPGEATSGSGVLALCRERGLAVVEYLGVDHLDEDSADYVDISGGMLTLAATPEGLPFGVLRLHYAASAERFAELLRSDSP